MKIRILGAHMFESKDSRLTSILIDNIMAIDAGALTSSLTFPEQEQIKYILLTHGHYDHIRDIPAFALKHQYRTTDIYATQSTLDILTTHFINGLVYPKFTEWPQPESPALRLNTIEQYEPITIGDYSVLTVPMCHSIPAWGYQVTNGDGKSVFFSGDTGPGLHSCWEHISPQVLIMDMGFSNKSVDIASKPGHLCPSLLGEELLDFHRTQGYFPKVIMTHLNPEVEDEVREEARQLATDLDIEISLAYDGMVIEL